MESPPSFLFLFFCPWGERRDQKRKNKGCPLWMGSRRGGLIDSTPLLKSLSTEALGSLVGYLKKELMELFFYPDEKIFSSAVREN